LDGIIGFEGIPNTIKTVLDETSCLHPESIKEVLRIDTEARAFATEVIGTERASSRAVRGVHSLASGHRNH